MHVLYGDAFYLDKYSIIIIKTAATAPSVTYLQLQAIIKICDTGGT
jgi:hypothetical protein